MQLLSSEGDASLGTMADGLGEIVLDEGFKEERTGRKDGSCREKVGHCARGE